MTTGNLPDDTCNLEDLNPKHHCSDNINLARPCVG